MGACQFPCSKIREPDISDLAVPHKVIKRSERLFKRGGWILMMGVVQVDVVGPQTPERRFALGNDVATCQATSMRTTIIWSIPNAFLNLGGDDHMVASATDRIAHEFL